MPAERAAVIDCILCKTEVGFVDRKHKNMNIICTWCFYEFDSDIERALEDQEEEEES